MILLPTRRRLERRREKLYQSLQSILQHASVHQVECIMRQIHGINQKLKTYFVRDHEPEELFEDKDPFETKDLPPFPFEEYWQGEEQF